jgi:hypothetical protein
MRSTGICGLKSWYTRDYKHKRVVKVVAKAPIPRKTMIKKTVKTAMNCLPNRGNRRGSKIKEKHQKDERFQNEKILRHKTRLKLYNGT